MNRWHIYYKLILVWIGIMAGHLSLNAQEKWQEVKLNSFYALEAGQHILLHPKFFVADQKWKTSIESKEVHTMLHIAKEAKSMVMFTYLAADNPMKWAFKIVDDTHAEWYNLSCDCNVGLESSIFSNNRNPYTKPVATLNLNSKGEVEVSYSDNFRKDFLSKAAFSNEFFLDTYRVYKQAAQ